MNFYIPEDNDLHYHKLPYTPKFLPDGSLDLKDLLHSFQDLATIHVNKLWDDYAFQEENHFSYVILRYKGYLLRKINPGEKLTFITFPTQASALQLYRYAYLVDEEGKPVFYLISLWVLIDTVNRKLMPSRCFRKKLKEVLPDIDTVLPLTEETLENFPIDDYSLSACGSYKVEPSDIDHNHHMNNTVYMEISQKLAKIPTISSFEIDFEKECFLDENISLSMASKENETLIVGYKEDGSLSFKTKFIH